MGSAGWNLCRSNRIFDRLSFESSRNIFLFSISPLKRYTQCTKECAHFCSIPFDYLFLSSSSLSVDSLSNIIPPIIIRSYDNPLIEWSPLIKSITHYGRFRILFILMTVFARLIQTPQNSWKDTIFISSAQSHFRGRRRGGGKGGTPIALSSRIPAPGPWADVRRIRRGSRSTPSGGPPASPSPVNEWAWHGAFRRCPWSVNYSVVEWVHFILF